MICTKCNQFTEERSFDTFRDKNGIVRRRGICRKCRGQRALDNFEYLQKWRKEYNVKNRTKKAIDTAARRDAVRSVVNQLKEETPCADCGAFWPAVAMDFDHVGPKHKSVAAMVSQAYKIELILEEIKQCEIVCACCHRIRTDARYQNNAPKKYSSAKEFI